MRLVRDVWGVRRVPGWTNMAEAAALAAVCYGLPRGAVVVEIGSFVGRSTIVLAAARRSRGTGVVHCVDPFDGRGDPYTEPVYLGVAQRLGVPLRAAFEANVAAAGLEDWVVVHERVEEEVAAGWSEPIDLLFLDGDQSPEGIAGAHGRWWRFLRPGGVLAVHNSAPVRYAPEHDGSFRLVRDVVAPPRYDRLMRVGTTTFARKRRIEGAAWDRGESERGVGAAARPD